MNIALFSDTYLPDINGCWDNGSGCLCGVWYPGWKEAQ